MTALNDILSDNWDTDICTKPSFITSSTANYRFYGRVVATQKVSKPDEIIGTVSRQYYDPDAHDAYNVMIQSTTSEADLENIISAIKKVCATYSPTATENILQWEGGDWIPFNGMVFKFTMTILVYRAGIAAYT